MKYVFGKTPSGYKTTLSYSAWSLWLKDKDLYRRRYYENEKFPENPEMLFGKKIAERLELNDPSLSAVPRYPSPEHEIRVLIDDVPVMGYIDSFEPGMCSFIEYKTGHIRADGSAPWDKVAVAKHEQLPFYSLLIYKKYGSVDRRCRLIWLETVFKQIPQVFHGETFGMVNNELELTGKMEQFERIVYKYERERIAKSIKDVARAITLDFHGYIAQKVRIPGGDVQDVGK